MQSNSDSSLRSLVSGPSSSVSSLQSDVVLSVRGVSKKFCRNLKRSMLYGMQDLARNMFGRQTPPSGLSPHPSLPPLRKDEFWALQDINFELKRGECLGLIGRNGSGKTTLLRLIAGIFPPDHGEITLRGRIGALIALGAGFHPHLTGRENIYLNGAILGLSRTEINGQLQEIIDFAEIGDFIDAPVSTYSSGMTVRLGFAVATAIKPDLLLVDEVLAVGDAAFRNRCYNRLGKLHREAAVIFVSHSTEQVMRVCDRALILAGGRSDFLGDVGEGVEHYSNIIRQASGEEENCFENILFPVTSVRFSFGNRVVRYGENLDFRAEIQAAEAVPGAILRIVFYDEEAIPFAEWNSDRIGAVIDLNKGQNVFSVQVGPILFKTGNYKLGININDNTGLTMLCWSFKRHEIAVEAFTSVGPSVALRSSIQRLT